MEPKRTPLFERHVKAGARIVTFAGFLMPIEFTGIVEEHLSVRNSVGIFDVSHMGEISISGEGALDYVNRLTTNDASKLDVCQAQYSTMLNNSGGIIDDLLVYRRRFDYLLVVNAANTEKDFAWIYENRPSGVRVENQSEATGQVALQGPRAVEIMVRTCDGNVADLGSFRSMVASIGGVSCLVSRTGYTGEDGFEIYADADRIGLIWDTLMETKPLPKPCGLGARDTLRLEAGMRLHGADIDETTTPLEAGLGWVVKFDKGDFFGKQALLEQKAKGLQRKLIGLKSFSKRFPRRGYRVVVDGKEVGRVTSGGFSPSLECGIAFAYVDKEFAKEGTDFKIDVRGHLIDATMVKGPFYKRRRD